MEYLNPSPVAALPQTMWLVHSAVMERPGVTSDTLFDLLVPEAMRANTSADGGHFKVALSRLLKLDLISEHEGGLRADAQAVDQNQACAARGYPDN